MRLYRGNTKYKLYSGDNIKKILLNNMVVPVEYLESTGTQYINTNIIPDAETGIYLKSTCSNNTDTYIVGLRDTNGDTRWCIGHSNQGYYYGYGSYVAISNRITNFTSKSYLNWLNNKKFISTDDNNICESNLSTLSFTPTNKIRLFGSSGVAASYAAWLGKIYEVKISQGSTIISDIIPVRIGSVGYMYDKISGQLFSNQGTGNFILGNDIN